MSSFQILCIFLVLIAIPTHGASDLITKTCEQTRYKDYCISTLKTAPAKNLASLTKHALKVASKKGVDIAKKLDQISKSSQGDEFIQQWVNDCSEVYQDAIDQLEDSTAAIDSKGYNKFNKWVSAAMTDAESCEDSFKELEGNKSKSPLGNFNAEFSQLCSIILTMSKLLPTAKN